MARRVFYFCFSLLLTHVVAGQLDPSRMFQLIQERGEIYVSIEKDDLKKRYDPFSLPGFDRSENNSLFLYLGIADSLFIIRNADLLNLHTPPSMHHKVRMTDERNLVLEGKAYPTYPLYLEIMAFFRDSFPEICRIDTIGRSVNGRLLLAARLTRSGKSPGEVPALFFSSSIHGDETAGYAFMLLLINQLIRSGDPEAVELLEESIVVINPLENPDGTYYRADSTVFGATRGNANGVNLNRNYPDPQDGTNPDGRARQPETAAMMKYLAALRPVLSANFHGGAELVNYPFDTWPAKHADDEWFQFISREYADQAASKINGYMDDLNAGITNGYEWYEVDGGRQDYVTYFLRGRETTIELSNVKLLSEENILNFWNANNRSLLKYLKQGTYGFHGLVKDSVTGKRLHSEVILLNHDKLNSSVFSDSASGYFFRPVKGGYYDIRIEAAGYRNRLLDNIFINDYEQVYLDVNMIPLYILPEILSIHARPNPFRDEFRVILELKEPGFVMFKLYDLYGNQLLSEFGDYVAGYFTETFRPEIAAGIYWLEVEYHSERYHFKIVKTE